MTATVATMSTQMLNPFLRRIAAAEPALQDRAVEVGQQILQAAGVPLSALADPTTRIPHDAAMALLEETSVLLGDPAFALRAGAGVERDDYGLFEYVSRSGATLRQSIWASCRFLPLLHDGAEAELIEQGELAIWRHRLRAGVRDSPGAHEYVVAAFVKGGADSLGLDVPPLEVHFIHQAPAYLDVYREIFRTDLRFGCDYNATVLPRAALELPMVNADAGLHTELLRCAAERLASLPRHRPFSQRVHELVREYLADGGAQMSVVAAKLAVSERSLRRRLLEEGTSHSQIQDEVRREAAHRLLVQPELDVSEVAFRLGFSHPPAFHRAFKRWYGMTPSEYRTQQRSTAVYDFYGRS